MSFDEINAILKAREKQDEKEWERQRWGWYYVLISQGSKAEKPQDIIKFPWELNKNKVKVLSKAQVEKKRKQAEKWLNNRSM